MSKTLWEQCVDFHGHACGGLTIGYKAALYAIQLLNLAPDGNYKRSPDNDSRLVCIAENDACGVDAMQTLLGCSVGKGNLLFHIRGKQAFSFYDRHSGASLRLALKNRPQNMSREESFAHYQSLEPEEMFTVEEAAIPLPESARIFNSYPCEACGEITGENWIRLQEGKKLCLDCYVGYSRFDV